jgi:hypothetical protein
MNIAFADLLPHDDSQPKVYLKSFEIVFNDSARLDAHTHMPMCLDGLDNSKIK